MASAGMLGRMEEDALRAVRTLLALSGHTVEVATIRALAQSGDLSHQQKKALQDLSAFLHLTQQALNAARREFDLPPATTDPFPKDPEDLRLLRYLGASRSRFTLEDGTEINFGDDVWAYISPDGKTELTVGPPKEFTFEALIEGEPNTTANLNALYEAGCDDATFGSYGGQAQGTFTRMAVSYRHATERAKAQIESVPGLRVTGYRRIQS